MKLKKSKLCTKANRLKVKGAEKKETKRNLKFTAFTCMCVCVCVCVCVCAHMCTYMCACVYMYVCMCVFNRDKNQAKYISWEQKKRISQNVLKSQVRESHTYHEGHDNIHCALQAITKATTEAEPLIYGFTAHHCWRNCDHCPGHSVIHGE